MGKWGMGDWGESDADFYERARRANERREELKREQARRAREEHERLKAEDERIRRIVREERCK